MSKKVDKLKKLAVALGYGSNVSEYTGQTTVHVLKEIAVKMQCAPSVDAIRTNSIAGVMEYIADNYGTEEREPFDLVVSGTHVTITVKNGTKTIPAGVDKLYNGDVLTITAVADAGYDLATLTVNGTPFVSGNTVTVNGHHITIAATTSLKTFDIARTATNATVTVTKEGVAVSDGENVLTYGDEVVISAVAAEGYDLDTLTVNGEDFVSGSTLTVDKDVSIVATATEPEE